MKKRTLRKRGKEDSKQAGMLRQQAKQSQVGYFAMVSFKKKKTSNLLKLNVQLNYGTNVISQKDPSRGALTQKPAWQVYFNL